MGLDAVTENPPGILTRGQDFAGIAGLMAGRETRSGFHALLNPIALNLTITPYTKKTGDAGGGLTLQFMRRKIPYRAIPGSRGPETSVVESVNIRFFHDKKDGTSGVSEMSLNTRGELVRSDDDGRITDDECNEALGKLNLYLKWVSTGGLTTNVRSTQFTDFQERVNILHFMANTFDTMAENFNNRLMHQ